MRRGDRTLRELLADEPEVQSKGDAPGGFSLQERVERTGDTEIRDAHPPVGDARDPGHSQHKGSASEAREIRSRYRSASAAKTSQVEAKQANRTEPVNLPQVGAVVRCKASLLRSPRRTSGRVKAILSEQYGQAVVIQSIWGDEVTVTAREFSRFFEECDPRDLARLYWESS